MPDTDSEPDSELASCVWCGSNAEVTRPKHGPSTIIHDANVCIEKGCREEKPYSEGNDRRKRATRALLHRTACNISGDKTNELLKDYLDYGTEKRGGKSAARTSAAAVSGDSVEDYVRISILSECFEKAPTVVVKKHILEVLLKADPDLSYTDVQRLGFKSVSRWVFDRVKEDGASYTLSKGGNIALAVEVVNLIIERPPTRKHN